MPPRVRAKTKAEEDYAYYEDMKHTTHKPDLFKGFLTLEHELVDLMSYGKSPGESQEDFMDELADNIRMSVDCLIQHQKLQRNPARLMSETQCAEYFLEKGIARLAKRPEYTVKTAQKAFAPLRAKLDTRGYWDPAAGKVDDSGVGVQ